MDCCIWYWSDTNYSALLYRLLIYSGWWEKAWILEEEEWGAEERAGALTGPDGCKAHHSQVVDKLIRLKIKTSLTIFLHESILLKPPNMQTSITLQLKGQWESSINSVFPEMKLLFPKQNYNVPSPSSYTHISVRDLYISRTGLLQGNTVCGQILGVYKSLTDTWMCKLD
jgi:hypothetical protein